MPFSTLDLDHFFSFTKLCVCVYVWEKEKEIKFSFQFYHEISKEGDPQYRQKSANKHHLRFHN